MKHTRFLLAVATTLVLTAFLVAQDKVPALQTAQGTVDKVEKDTLTIRPRLPDGKFGKNLALKFTGTSKVTTVSIQKRSGKEVAVQRDTEPKDLQRGQSIAVIYTTVAANPILLSAVAQSAPEK